MCPFSTQISGLKVICYDKEKKQKGLSKDEDRSEG